MKILNRFTHVVVTQPISNVEVNVIGMLPNVTVEHAVGHKAFKKRLLDMLSSHLDIIEENIELPEGIPHLDDDYMVAPGSHLDMSLHVVVDGEGYEFIIHPMIEEY